MIAVEVVQPTPPPAPDVTITLSLAEAALLCDIAGSVGGSPHFIRQELFNPLFTKLTKALRAPMKAQGFSSTKACWLDAAAGRVVEEKALYVAHPAFKDPFKS